MKTRIRMWPIIIVTLLIAGILGAWAYSRLTKTDVLLRVDSRTGNARAGFQMDYSKLGPNLNVTTKMENHTGEEWPAPQTSFNPTTRSLTLAAQATPPIKGHKFINRTESSPLAITTYVGDSDNAAILAYIGNSVGLQLCPNAGAKTSEQKWSTKLLSITDPIYAADMTYRGSQLVIGAIVVDHSTGVKTIQLDTYESGTFTTRYTKVITPSVHSIRTVYQDDQLYCVAISGTNEATVVSVGANGWESLVDTTITVDNIKSIDIQFGSSNAIAVLHDNDKTFQFYAISGTSYENTTSWYLPGTVIATSAMAFNVATKGRYRLVYQKGSDIYTVVSDQNLAFPTPTRIISDAQRLSKNLALRTMTNGTNIVLYIHQDGTFRYATDTSEWDVGMYVNKGVKDSLLSFVATIDSEDKIHHASTHTTTEGTTLRHYATPPNGKYDDVTITNHVYTSAYTLS